MKIHVLSDLHTEFGLRSVLDALRPVTSDILVLAGDIAVRGEHGREHDRSLNAILDRVGPSGFMYIPGNHEYYSTGCASTASRQEYRNGGGFLMKGCTLWYPDSVHARDRDNQNRMADFRHMDYDWCISEHEKDMSFLTSGPTPDVIVTHHLPSRKSTPTRYAGNALDCYFVTPGIADLLQPRVWIHGHTHDSFDYKLGNTRVVCNPRGYPGELNPDWDPCKVIDV